MQFKLAKRKIAVLVFLILLIPITLNTTNRIIVNANILTTENKNTPIYLIRVNGNPLSYLSYLSKYGTIRYVYPAFDVISIKPFSLSLLPLIRRVSGVLSVEKNTIFRISDSRQSICSQGFSDNFNFNISLDTSVDVIDVRRVWNVYNFRGENITVGVIDTGIDVKHVGLDDLDDNNSTNDPKVIGWIDFINNRTEPYDDHDHGHGTHVAGIIAGTGAPDYKYIGVAPKAKLVGVKVLNSSGEGDAEHVLLGLQWFIDNKERFNITIVNISFTSDNPSDGTDIVSLAVDQLVLNGIIVIVAAGNSGSKGIGSPAASLLAITVGSTTKDKNHPTLAISSSRGPTLDGRIKPDVCAPGVGIMSVRANSHIGYTPKSGTSMAAPHVAGLVALLEDANSSLTSAEIKFILTNTSRSFYNVGNIPNNDEGYGLVQGMAAIDKALNFTGIPKLNITVNIANPQSYLSDFHITISSGVDNVSFYFLFYNTLTGEPSYIVFAMINKSQSIDISLSTDILYDVLNVSGDTQLRFTFVAFRIGYLLTFHNYSISLVKSVSQNNSTNTTNNLLWLIFSSVSPLFILGVAYIGVFAAVVVIILRKVKYKKATQSIPDKEKSDNG